uniref:Uncharacterized protein n=1 Tax=Meloidogyne enterolobii TaxID=390850 RepID=A0A6V7Y2Q8_MELEN|nr:unnamed protein product [Meloidogyne enterolobii]
MCTTSLCNTQEFFKKVNYCWGKENFVEQCDISKYGLKCYYASDLDNKVEQGCGDLQMEISDRLYAKCSKPLCNTKDLFDKTLFCFNKGKEEFEAKKGIKQCNQKCFVHRHFDGKCLFLIFRIISTNLNTHTI